MKLFHAILVLILMTIWVNAQVVTSEPPFPTQQDSIVVFFDASEGDQGLMGYTGNDVYAHTGVITNESAGPTDWKHVIAEWDEDKPKALLTRVDTDLYKLNIGFPREYYNVSDPNEEILQLAFVFRNSGASRTGRAVGGDDIFLDLFKPGLTVVLSEPQIDDSFGDPKRSPHFAFEGDTVDISATAATIGTEIDQFKLFKNSSLIAQIQDDTLNYQFIVMAGESGYQKFTVVAEDTASITDTTMFYVMVNPEVQEAAVPQGVRDGINYKNSTTVTLSLFAPHKEFIYVIGDFNDWKVDTTFYMKKEVISSDSVRWWLTIDGLTPGKEYGFQYLVDGNLRIADPFTEKVLDPWNDQFISSSTYPDLKPYPEGKTEHVVGILQTDQQPFTWVYSDTFQRPAKKDLVIYELLIRDFIAAHNYQTMQDTLDYLDNLGVTAIELMPIMEFEGNSSWGYNPSFYFAPDKYYGPAEELKKFIDECHRRGIAVILDMVLNHAFGQNSLVRLYWDSANNRPAPNNPWFNQIAKHDFNVGFDFNHESRATQYFVDRVNKYWLTEFKFDGYRFDLSKGFTQKNTLGDVSQWGQFDQSRIDLLNRMANQIWETDSTAYIILEHFAENSEEKLLSNAGMMLWGNLNGPYSQSAMGWLEDSQRSSNLAGGYYKNRGWSKPHLVTYMESHDEPWLMYKNLQFGRSSGGYDIQNLNTALNRIKLVASFFLTYPGPKMMWQFGELGYDQELPEIGRTDPKPILWNYFTQPERRKLYRTYAALIKLRRENEVFTSTETDVNMRVGQGQFDRRVNLSHPSMNVTIIGNFDVVEIGVDPNFQHTGRWYNYFERDSVEITDVNQTVVLNPGEFHIFTDKKVEFPQPDLVTAIEKNVTSLPQSFELGQNYPNPFNPTTTIDFQIPKAVDVKMEVYNILGQSIQTLVNKPMQPGSYQINWNGKDRQGNSLSSGIYILHFKAGDFVETRRMLLLK